MILPTPDKVREIIDTAKPDGAIESCIAYAAMVAEEYISHLSGARQTAIITWIAAHFLASTDVDAVRTSEKLGDGADSFARAQLGPLLMGTPYGQQAVLLAGDELATAGKPTVSIEPIV